MANLSLLAFYLCLHGVYIVVNYSIKVPIFTLQFVTKNLFHFKKDLTLINEWYPGSGVRDKDLSIGKYCTKLHIIPLKPGVAPWF